MNQSPKILESDRIEKLGALLLLVTSFFVALLAVDSLMGLFEPRPTMGNSITVQGTGTASAVPNMATVGFTVSENATNASNAQDAAAQKVNVAIAVLTGDLGIAAEDIRTTSYNVFPRYNQPPGCFDGFCPPYEQRIIGYTASQTVEVKVRNTDAVGEVLSQLGDAGVSNLFGPNFTIDEPDALQAEAREKAVANARKKAEALAASLGVRLVRVSGFWEDMGPYYGYPEKAVGLGGADARGVTPELPPGENEVSVSVSISYEIR